jgi:hypothetical protein
MKYSLPLLLLLFSWFTCYSQDRDFSLYFHEKNTIKPGIDSIDSVSFFKIRRTGIRSGPVIQSIYLPDEINRAADSTWKANESNKKQKTSRMDSIVRLMKEKYPSAFQEKDSCLILNGSDQKIKICRSRCGDMKEMTYYEYKDYIRDYLLIEQCGYESWIYLLFNPKTRNYKYFEHTPYFINNSIAYCSDNYYGEGGFQIIHMLGKFYFGFETYSWELEECYRIDKVFYPSFRSNYNQNLKPKYITINFTKCF